MDQNSAVAVADDATTELAATEEPTHEIVEETSAYEVMLLQGGQYY